MSVGHKPYVHVAWLHHPRVGHYYSNPTNWMWRILKETGIAPPQIRYVSGVWGANGRYIKDDETSFKI